MSANDHMRFPTLSLVRETTTGRVYQILGTPGACAMESTKEPVYLYTDYRGSDEIWVRPALEMEDGRFARLNS